MNRLLLICWLLLGALPVFAEKWSYLYIQGDQKTPFYVKLDSAMQPRYGKNYNIIPKLAPGPIHIEILFQQNIYPSQQFNIRIPEDGYRGFLLVAGKDSSFQLYDLQQGFYLKANNDINDDHEPARAAPAAVSVTPAAVPIAPAAVPAKAPLKKAEHHKTATKPPPPPTPGAPVFIGDMELSHEKNAAVVKDSNSETTEKNVTATKASDAGSCAKAMTSDEFQPIFQKFSHNSNDEDKLAYIFTQLDACYETWQIRTLSENLEGDAARYSLMKKLYPRTTDLSAFPMLDDLLIDASWKAEFVKLIHP
jgi:hypothetical protein